MPSSSATGSERSRKNAAMILQRLASVGQANLARELGTSEATISRWKAEQAEQCAAALSILGLKVVPVEFRCYRPDMVQALLTLARDKLDQIEQPEQLAWE